MKKKTTATQAKSVKKGEEPKKKDEKKSLPKSEATK